MRKVLYAVFVVLSLGSVEGIVVAQDKRDPAKEKARRELLAAVQKAGEPNLLNIRSALRWGIIFT